MTQLLLYWQKNFFSLTEFFRDNNGSWIVKRGVTHSLPKEEVEDHLKEKVLQQFQQTLDSWGVRKATLHCILPTDRIFLRTVKIEIPPGLDEVVPSLVAIEAKHILPSPLEELIWNFQILPSSEPESISVTYAAIKRASFALLLEIILATDFEVKTLAAAPCVICRGLQLMDQSHNVCMLIEIGASVINAILISHNQVISSYLVALSPLYLEDFELNLTKMESTLSQILEYEEAKKIIPTQIFVSGKGAFKNQLCTFLQEILKLPVSDLDEFLKSHLSKIHLSIGTEALEFSNNPHSCSWSLLVGITTLFAKETDLSLNLFPPALVAKKHTLQQRPYLIGTIALLACTFLSWSLYFNYETHRIMEATSHAVNFLDQNQKKLIESDRLLADFKKVEEEKAAFSSLLESRAAWPKLIQELQQALPQRHLWITQLSPISDSENSRTALPREKNKRTPSQSSNTMLIEKADHSSSPITMISMEGLYLENPRQAEIIDDFVEKLKRSDFFAISNQEETILLRCPPNKTTYAYAFKLLLPLRNPITSDTQ